MTIGNVIYSTKKVPINHQTKTREEKINQNSNQVILK